MLFKVFYTNTFIAQRFAAQTYGPLIFIRPSYSLDKGLLEHEKVHVKQFWRNPLFGLWYLFSKKDRLGYEVEAYREQLKYSPDAAPVFASHIATKYNLKTTVAEALVLLLKD